MKISKDSDSSRSNSYKDLEDKGKLLSNRFKLNSIGSYLKRKNKIKKSHWYPNFRLSDIRTQG